MPVYECYCPFLLASTKVNPMFAESRDTDRGLW